jgi:hypothetical protein
MFASRLIGLPPPPEVLFVDAKETMSPTARSFYEANRRVCNRKLKGELGVTLRYCGTLLESPPTVLRTNNIQLNYPNGRPFQMLG